MEISQWLVDIRHTSYRRRRTPTTAANYCQLTPTTTASHELDATLKRTKSMREYRASSTNATQSSLGKRDSSESQELLSTTRTRSDKNQGIKCAVNWFGKRSRPLSTHPGDYLERASMGVYLRRWLFTNTHLLLWPRTRPKVFNITQLWHLEMFKLRHSLHYSFAML